MNRAPGKVLRFAVLTAMLLTTACDGSDAGGDSAPIVNPPAQVQPDPLANWFLGTFAGKKLVFWGNSTVSNAVYFFDQLRSYTASGASLAGLDPALILNYGSNGASLAAMLNGQGAYAISAVIAAQPDLLVIRGPLINDVRLGATSLEQAEQLLASALDQIRAGSPRTAIVLTTENSLLTTDVGSHGYVQPNDAAQRYTDILHTAVLTVGARYPDVRVLDVMSLEYGVLSPSASMLMGDQMHPNEAGQRAEANLIAGLIGRSH